MRRLNGKDQVRHFLVWLALYLGLSIAAINLGAHVGISDHAAVAIPLSVLAVIIFHYLRRTGIAADIGLGVRSAVSVRHMWFYLPLLILACLPLTREVGDELAMSAVAAMVVHYLSAGFLEEVLFRELLLRALLKKWKPVWAVAVTALTFGIGHAVSVFVGQSGTDTILQIIDATTSRWCSVEVGTDPSRKSRSDEGFAL